MNSDIADFAKWARSQGWTIQDDSKGYTRFTSPQGGLRRQLSRYAEQPVQANPGSDGGAEESGLAVARAQQERTTRTTQQGRHEVNTDWVITFTYDVDPSMATMDFWESQLEAADVSVAYIPGRGVDVTAYAPGDLVMFDAVEKTASEIGHVVQAEPIGMEMVREPEWQRRAQAPTMPELMSAAEIAIELGVSRQRVHQLRETATFPAPLADLRGGAVWDAAAVRKFGREWSRKPGRPRTAS